MSPAHKYDHPEECFTYELLSLLCVWSLIYTLSTNSDLVLLHQFLVCFHQLKHPITCLWLFCHVMCVNQICLRSNSFGLLLAWQWSKSHLILNSDHGWHNTLCIVLPSITLSGANFALYLQPHLVLNTLDLLIPGSTQITVYDQEWLCQVLSTCQQICEFLGC